jgi:hypothetical protein
VGEVEDIPLFFTLIPVLALLSNYDRENCLNNVGTEGAIERRQPQYPLKGEDRGWDLAGAKSGRSANLRPRREA